MEPEYIRPTPAASDANAETVESRYVAREVNPRNPSQEVVERTQTRRGLSPSAAAGVRRNYAFARARQIVYLILGILESLLIIRFVLKLLAANPDASFTSFIYGLTNSFVAPFTGVFPTPQTQGTILDLAAVLAMIVYALIAWGIVSLLYALDNRRPALPA